MWTLLAALFWADLAILVFTYVGYPLVLRLAAVLRGRREVAAGGETAPVTLVVSLHDELEVLEEKIRNSLGLSWEGTASVVLADDGSEDGSEELCHRYATARPDEVRHVRIPRGGKNRALDAALATIPGGIVVFTDANAFLEPGALRLLASTFQDPHVGCAVGRLRFRRQGQTLEGTYWRYGDAVKRLEGALGRMVVGNGGILAARRHLVPALLPGLANDLQIPLAVARAGARTVFVQDAVAWEHLSDSAGEEHARKVRMATRGLSHVPEMLRLAPGILKAQYLVHKVLRWLTGVALVEVLALNVILAFGMGGLYTALLACQGLFYAAAALGAVAEGRNLRVPLLRFPRYFVLMHLAGLEAVMNVLRGRTFETWEKPTSTRRGGAPLPGGA